MVEKKYIPVKEEVCERCNGTGKVSVQNSECRYNLLKDYQRLVKNLEQISIEARIRYKQSYEQSKRSEIIMGYLAPEWDSLEEYK